MPRSEKVVPFRKLIRLPGVLPVFIASSLSRLSYGMIGLAMLLTIQRASGSFAVAGSAGATFGIFTLSAPIKSRWVDQYGQRRLILILGSAFSASLLTLAVIALQGVHSTLVYVAITSISGLLAPPIGPAIRAVWASLTHGITTLHRTYSLDVIVEDVLFTAGPLIVGGVVAINGPTFALALGAILMLVGCVSFAWAPVVAVHDERQRSHHRVSIKATLRSPDFMLLLGAVAALSSTLGIVDIAVVARAVREGTPAAAGYLLAAVTLGGGLGASLWARRDRFRSTFIELGILSVVLAVCLIGSAGAPNMISLAIALTVFGAALTPALVVSYVAADRLGTRAGTTEASAWVNTAFNGGIAMGTVVAGFAIGPNGSTNTLTLTAVFAGVTAVLLLARGRRSNASLSCSEENLVTGKAGDVEG